MKVQLNQKSKIEIPNWAKNYLLEDREYFVLGILIEGNQCYFYIDVDHIYPIKLSASIFNVTNAKLSKHWKFKVVDSSIKFQFDDWLEIPNFLNYFVNADKNEDPSFYNLREYVYYKNLIVNE